MIRRDDPDPRDLQEVQRQMSYLAKNDQKTNVKARLISRQESKRRNENVGYYMTRLSIVSIAIFTMDIF